MGRIFLLLTATSTFLAVPAAAQLGLPSVGLPGIGGVADLIGDTVEGVAEVAPQSVQNLVRVRSDRIEALLRRYPERIERDAEGNPARAGEMLLMDIGPAALELVRQEGFTVVGSETIEGLDIEVVRLTVPSGTTMAQAEGALRTLLPGATISADNLHFQVGGSIRSSRLSVTPLAATGAVPVGVIDGAPGMHTKISALRGFAEGAPYPSNHGSAIVSLLAHAGARDIRVADVYGIDVAGGNAIAIARGLGWLTNGGAKVVTISLVGPRNALLERAVTTAQKRGVLIIAAVGNDGPAAPPAYPASYEGVVAVSGVDSRNRALIEAGRALHLDYTAPGADLRARNAKGKTVKVRGTSFAVPLVAARAATQVGSRSETMSRLDVEAVDLGEKGHDAIYGRGLICGRCRP